MINNDRLAVANQVMALMFPEPNPMKLTTRNNRICLYWVASNREHYEKKWECQHGSWYPTIYRSVPIGGTSAKAISQLVNWIRDRPVLPIQTWEYWCGDTVRLEPKDKILAVLRDSDYPQKYECRWCGSPKNLDWYNFGNQSGLGCMHSSRCDPLSSLLKQHQEKMSIRQ